MSDDRTTIGLTSNNKDVIQEIMPYFNEQLDAAKFAMALSIKEGHEPDRTTGTETVWNTGSFDPDGELRDLLTALYPETERPYLAIEYFVNQGLDMLADHLENNKELDIPELV
jgi:hypothetical protein